MNLEDLIKKYDKNIFFKIKTKLKHYKKQIDLATKISLISTFGILFYQHLEFYKETISIVEDSISAQGKMKRRYENCIKEGKIKNLEKIALAHKIIYNKNYKKFIQKKYEDPRLDWNLKFLPYVFIGMFSFLLAEDIFVKKKTKLTKNFSRYALTSGGLYAFLTMMDSKPISTCNLEEIFNKSLITYNLTLIQTGFNYVAYTLFHDFIKKPIALNLPKYIFYCSKYFITFNKTNLEKAYSFFKYADIYLDIEKGINNLKKDYKFNDISKTKEKLDLIIKKDVDNLKGHKSSIDLKHLILSLNYLSSQKNKKENPKFINHKINNFELMFSKNKYAPAFDELKSILNHKKYAYDFSIVYSIIFEDFVDKINNNINSLDLEGVIKFGNSVGNFNNAVVQTWDKTIGFILNDSKTQFKNTYGDRIKAIVSSEYLKRTLAFKKGKLDDLKNEKMLSEELERVLHTKEGFSVARPISIINLVDECYYVNGFSEGISFMDIKQLNHYEKCVDLLKIIHSNIKSKKEIRNYKEDVEKRIVGLDNKFSEMFKCKSWKYIWNYIDNSCSAVFDGDPHGEQMILSDNEIVRIDMEDKGLIQWPFQLNKLTIQSGMKGKNYENLVNRYCDGNNMFENIKAYLLATIPSALSYISRTHGDKTKIKQREIYLNCAIHAAEELNLNDLKKHIKKIKI